MDAAAPWRWFSTPRGVGHWLMVVVLDVLLATAVSTGFFLAFGVVYVNESYPPQCSTYLGNGVDCDLERALEVARWVVFGAVLVGLLVTQLVRSRRSACPTLNGRPQQPLG